MAQLCAITRDESAHNSTENVFFCAHPDDYVLLDRISAEILKQRDCTVWYDSEPEEEYNKRKLGAKLNKMQLFVVPVTESLLTQPSRALEYEMKLAKRKNIPVMPIVQQEGIEELFRKKCGDMTLFYYDGRETDGISGEKKLCALFETAFGRICDPFENENIICIGSACRDLNSADIFNPVGVKLEKSRICAKYVSLPELENQLSDDKQRKLSGEKLYDMAMHALDIKNPEGDADKAIRLMKTAADKGSTDALGKLAEFCYEGKYVAKDTEAAIRYREKQTELLEEKHKEIMTDDSSLALSNKLWDIGDWSLETGSYDECFRAYTRMYELNCESAEKFASESARRYVSVSLNKLGDLYERRGNKSEALKHYLKAIDILAVTMRDFDSENMRKDMRLLCSRIQKIYKEREEYDTARIYAQAGVDVSVEAAEKNSTYENRREVVNAYINLGDVYLMRGDNGEARRRYESALELSIQICGENYDDVSLFDVGLNYEKIANCHEELKQFDTAVDYYKKAFYRYAEAAEISSSLSYRKAQTIICNRVAEIYRAKSNMSAACICYEKSYEIRADIARKMNTAEAKEDVAYVCSMLGEICRDRKDIEQSEKYYRESIKLRVEVLEMDESDNVYDSLAVSYYNLARLSTPVADQDMMRKAYEIWKRLSEKYTDNAEYARRCAIAKRSIVE